MMTSGEAKLSTLKPKKKGRGRPAGKGRVHVQFTLTPNEADQLREVCQVEKRSMANWVKLVVVRELDGLHERHKK